MNYKIWGISVIIASLFMSLLFSFININEVDLVKTEFIDNLTPDKVDDNLNYALYELTDYKTSRK